MIDNVGDVFSDFFILTHFAWSAFPR